MTLSDILAAVAGLIALLISFVAVPTWAVAVAIGLLAIALLLHGRT